MKAKTKIGMGMKAKKKAGKKKKRILPTAKRSGVLPILPILGALGSLIGRVTSVAKAINDRKAAQRHSRNCNVARWKRADRDCISLHTNTDRDCISSRTKADEA
ncbi:hypothetical protein P5V15_015815 [Pogonomyrmex californicus]